MLEGVVNGVMEPDCELSFNSDKTNFELLIDQFETVTDLNWTWLRFKEDNVKESYDDIATMCLEMNYKCYICSEDKEKYRFVQFQPDLIVDLEFLCETTEKFEENGFETERCEKPEEHRRHRPSSVFNRYRHPVKPAKRKKGRENNPLLFHEDKLTWLANQWYERNEQKPPTRSQILKGVINADRFQMLRLFPKYPLGHAAMDKVLVNRKLAWQLLSIVSGFSECDANEPIDQKILES